MEAEVKLAALLIRHGLIQEALSALDRAGGKAKDAKSDLSGWRSIGPDE